VQQPPQAVALDVAAPRRVRRIQPSRGIVPIDFAEIWRFRELLYAFLLRDVKARYKQTYLGGFWAVFRPLVSMVLFTIIFGHLAGIKPGGGLPYALFVYPGLLAWTYFSSCVTGGASGIANNAGLLSKAYFPRIYAPLSAIIAPLVDFALSLVTLVGLYVYYHHMPNWHVIFLPFFLVLAVLIGLGIGLWLSGITVRFRDVPFALPFVLQLWMYLTPVIYPVTLVPERYRWLLALNPAAAVVDGFRWCLLGASPPSVTALVINVAITTALVGTGLYYFRRVERTIVDLF
jgi:lipopolysaccharide transport system permease protein